MKIKTLIGKIDRFNDMLKEAIDRMDGNNEFVEVGTTIIGEFGTIDSIEYKHIKNKLVVKWEGEKYVIKEEDGELIGDDYTLLDCIQHYKRRIKKSLKIWESENPDEELENEDDEE